MNCLIVAAGQGARLREKGELKPLIPIRGKPLIECVIGRARAAGVDEFFVVSGYRGAELRAALDSFAARQGIRINHIVNGEWNRANGVSVLSAKADDRIAVSVDHVRPSSRPGNSPRPDGHITGAGNGDTRGGF